MSNRDLLHVGRLPGLEPEEQPVTREVDLAVDVKGSISGERLGQLNTIAQITKPAHEVATRLRRICFNCKHFDQDKARRVFEEAQKTQEGQTELRNLYGNLNPVGGLPRPATFTPTVGDLYPLGYCHAFSSPGKDMIVHPLSNCPTESPHLGFGDRFEALDRSAVKRGDAGYDQIMKRAEGKEPT